MNQLALINGTLPWLTLFRFLGMGLLFTATTVALTVVIRTLQGQEKNLPQFIAAQTAN